MDSTRLFVGNLPNDINEKRLIEIFSKYGTINKIELKKGKFIDPPSCFAFVTIDGNRRSLEKCVNQLSSDKSVWNGYNVNLDFAKESFLTKLEKERLDPKNKNIIPEETVADNRNKKKFKEDYNENGSTREIKKLSMFQVRNIKINQNNDAIEKINETFTSSESSSDDDDNDTDKSNDYNESKENERKLIQAMKKNNRFNKKLNLDLDLDYDDDEDGENKNCNEPKIGQKNITQAVKQDCQKISKNKINKCSNTPKDDSIDEYNLRNIVTDVNDVMKDFEQFSNVWQDSDDDNNGDKNYYYTSDDEIFESFKKKQNNNVDKHKNDNNNDNVNGIKRNISTKKTKVSDNNDIKTNLIKSNSLHINKKISESEITSSDSETEYNNEFYKNTNNNALKSKENTVSFDDDNMKDTNDFIKFVKKDKPEPKESNFNNFGEVKVSKFPKYIDIYNQNNANFNLKETNKRQFENSNKEHRFNDKIYCNKFEDEEFSNKNNNTFLHGKVEMNKDKNKIEKKNKVNEKSESKRMNAMEERRKEIEIKKNAIKQALSNVDINKSNKKIIFNINNDGEEESADITKLNDNDTNVSKQNSNVSKSNTYVKDKKNHLFESNESSSESEEDDGDNVNCTRFDIKKQFEGNKGQKLLELQSTYNNDNRFNLDDRFVESGSESDTPNKSMKGGVGGIEEDSNEKETQYKILEDVLGYKIKHPATRNGLLQMARFDPLNPQHKQMYITINENKKGKIKTKNNSKKRKLTNEEVEVSKETFYEIDETYLKQSRASVNTTVQPFSLLKLFNRDYTSEDDDKVEDNSNKSSHLDLNKKDDYKIESISNPSLPSYMSLTSRFKYDSSSDDDVDDVEMSDHSKNDNTEKKKNNNDDNDNGNKKAQRIGQFGTGLKSMEEKMFFVNQDDRFKEAEDFWKQKPIEKLNHENYNIKRRELALKLKTKIRRNMKNSFLNKTRRKKSFSGRGRR